MATKFGTLFHSKDTKEVQELEKEGANAISIQTDAPFRFDDDNFVMVVGEERIVLQPHALENTGVVELVSTLLRWINDVLESKRIIVRDIVEDIFDGQVLGELLAELTGEDLAVIGVTQSAYMQVSKSLVSRPLPQLPVTRNKLKTLVERVDRLLGISESQRKWSMQGIHSKEVVEILHLLVALARYFRCPHPLPINVRIRRIHLKQLENKLETQMFEEVITGDDIRPIAPVPQVTDRDVFDKLFEEAPEKLEAVKRSLCQFASKVLQEVDIIVTDLDSQFHNGVYLILMLGILEGYFIPLYQFHYTPVSFDEKLDNVGLAFRLLEEAGLPQKRVKPDDIVHRDLKSTLRVLYAIFGKYKSVYQPSQSQQQKAEAARKSPVSEV